MDEKIVANQIILPDGSTKPELQFKGEGVKGYWKSSDGIWRDQDGLIIEGSFQCFDEEVKSK